MKGLLLLAVALMILISGCTAPPQGGTLPTAGDQLQASENLLDTNSDTLLQESQGTEQDLLEP